MIKYSSVFVKLIVFSCGLALLLPSCRKYDDGPSFSLRSKVSRVTNNWNADIVARNNIDETEFYDTYNMVFDDKEDSDGRMGLTWTIKRRDMADSVITARWELASVNEQIKLTMTDFPTVGETALLYIDILRLEEDAMWLRFLTDGDYYNVQLE